MQSTVPNKLGGAGGRFGGYLCVYYQWALCVYTNKTFLYFFAYFISGIALPALWMIVTETIYDVRESYNCARTFDTDFT